MGRREIPVRKLLSVPSRRRILEELIKNGESTAYELAKKLEIPDSAVGKHLKILCEAGLVEEPNIDVSEGRLKKIYKLAPHAEKLLKEFWISEIQSVPESIQRALNREMHKKGEGASKKKK